MVIIMKNLLYVAIAITFIYVDKKEGIKQEVFFLMSNRLMLELT